MKRFSFLLPAFAGTFIYVLLSLTGGQNSFWAEHQLENQKQILSLHTADIQKINNELTLEYIALQKDPDVIAAYAKKLGYVGENEKLVKITCTIPELSRNIRKSFLFLSGCAKRRGLSFLC
mgnify:CR=1 FL=1